MREPKISDTLSRETARKVRAQLTKKRVRIAYCSSFPCTYKPGMTRPSEIRAPVVKENVKKDRCPDCGSFVVYKWKWKNGHDDPTV